MNWKRVYYMRNREWRRAHPEKIRQYNRACYLRRKARKVKM